MFIFKLTGTLVKVSDFNRESANTWNELNCQWIVRPFFVFLLVSVGFLQQAKIVHVAWRHYGTIEG